MRIQHNISALNSYRQMGGNNNALSKNLEKLSSGYRINRAGDDAAGLAISEKMRAQIKGLETAQKNANDGISLVQTAEGALTEVHSMLNRMTELATQSANGTYDKNVDRANLQKEVSALLEEIDRISESTNFNGINLLDGSLGGGAAVSGTGAFDDLKGTLAGNIKDVDAVKAKSTVAFKMNDGSDNRTDKKYAIGDTFTFSFEMSDGSKHEIKMTVSKIENSKATLVDENGAVLAETAADTFSENDIAKAVAKAINDGELGKVYKASDATGTLTLEALAGGAHGENITTVSLTGVNSDGKNILGADASKNSVELVQNTKTDLTKQVKGLNASEALDLSTATIYDKTTDLEDCVFEIKGHKFAFIDETNFDKDEDLVAALAELDKQGITYVKTGGNTVGVTHVTTMMNKIKEATGLNLKQGTYAAGTPSTFTEDATTGTFIYIEDDGEASTGKGKGLKLQIGDTADDFNQLVVSIDSMSSKSLGIDKIDIRSPEGASAAIGKIKNAINTVSSTRGDLGAIQNRLEHTINNLGVTTENLTAAESRIRDTDMASEMMQYTKNNILIQASQAMLAQANQVPQGVLQLLQ